MADPNSIDDLTKVAGGGGVAATIAAIFAFFARSQTSSRLDAMAAQMGALAQSVSDLNGASDHVLCEGAIGIDLSTSNASGVVGVTNPSTNVGVSRNDQYLTDIARWDQPIGEPRTRIRHPEGVVQTESLSAALRNFIRRLP